MRKPVRVTHIDWWIWASIALFLAAVIGLFTGSWLVVVLVAPTAVLVWAVGRRLIRHAEDRRARRRRRR